MPGPHEVLKSGNQSLLRAWTCGFLISWSYVLLTSIVLDVGKIRNICFGSFAPLPPTPTCATPTPTTAIERRRWRKRLHCPYIRFRNLKSLSLCKNRRMNFGATAERCLSTPGLYREKSPTTSVFSCYRSRPRLSTARPFMSVRSFTNGFSGLCGSLTTTKFPCTVIWTGCWNTTSQPSTRRLRSGAAAGFRLLPGILKRHCHGNSQCRIPDL